MGEIANDMIEGRCCALCGLQSELKKYKELVEDQDDLWYGAIEIILSDSSYRNEGLPEKLKSKYLLILKQSIQ